METGGLCRKFPDAVVQNVLDWTGLDCLLAFFRTNRCLESTPRPIQLVQSVHESRPSSAIASQQRFSAGVVHTKKMIA